MNMNKKDETSDVSLVVNGVEYVLASSVPPRLDDSYVIVRSALAGVFAGALVEHDRATGTVELVDTRRLWYWAGAASLSQLAVDGVGRPLECKFAMAVPMITVAEVLEVIRATPAARSSIEGVPVWKA